MVTEEWENLTSVFFPISIARDLSSVGIERMEKKVRSFLFFSGCFCLYLSSAGTEIMEKSPQCFLFFSP